MALTDFIQGYVGDLIRKQNEEKQKEQPKKTTLQETYGIIKKTRESAGKPVNVVYPKNTDPAKILQEYNQVPELKEAPSVIGQTIGKIRLFKQDAKTAASALAQTFGTATKNFGYDMLKTPLTILKAREENKGKFYVWLAEKISGEDNLEETIPSKKTYDENVVKFFDDRIKDVEKLQKAEYEELDKDWQKELYKYASGGVSLAVAIGTALIMRDPKAAGALFGIIQGSDEYNNARSSGKSSPKALATALASGVGTSILESYGASNLLKTAGKPLLNRIMVGFLSEGAEEGTQQIWQNLVAKVGYDEGRQIIDGLKDSILVGAVTGGFGSTVLGDIKTGEGYQKDAVQLLKEKGVEENDAKIFVDELSRYSQPLVENFLKNYNIYKERRLVGLRGDVEDSGQLRPGIEKSAPLPSKDLDQLPWESESEWRARIGKKGEQEKRRTEYQNNVPELEGKEYLKYQAEKVIQGYIDEYLKPGMQGGVEQGGLSRDQVTGEVVGRTGRVSLNDKWYQNFYATNKRKPTVKELREIAVKHLTEGYSGNNFETTPNEDFLELKTKMDELGIKIPLDKLSQKGFKELQKQPLTLEKESLRRMAKTGATLTELGMEGEKGERLRSLKRELAKRMGIEKKIESGEFEAINADDLAKIRKGGGVMMGAIKLADKGAGKITSTTIRLLGKVVDKITELPKLKDWKEYAKAGLAKLTPQYGLSDDVYKALESYRKSQNREYKGISETLRALAEATGEEELPEKAFQYLSGEQVELSDELKQILDPIRDEIDIEGLRQVMIGNLPKEVFFANMGRYMRRLYGAHQLESFSPLAESYNNLKNAFIGKGLSEIDAEEAIAGIVTNNIKDKYKGILSPNIKTGGAFQKARKLGDDKVSLVIRDFLGEIQDPEYAIGRTLFDLKRSRLNYELLNGLAQTEAVKDAVPAGYVKDYKKLDGKEWGALDGKYMQKDVFNYLQAMRAKDETWSKWLTKTNNFIKANLTVRNPGGQFRNLTSNFATSQAILGHNYLSASGMNDLYKATKSLRDKDGFYQELVAYGRIGNTGITEDLGQRLEDVFNGSKKTKSDILRMAKKVDNILGKVYEFGDTLFLMANYQKLRAKGASPIESIKEASRVTPDYGEVSPLIAKLRKNIIGLPFVTWRYKVYPEIIKEIISSPIKGTLPVWFPWVVGNIIAGALDMTDTEKEVFQTRLYRDGKIPIGRGENGDMVYFDYGQYTPYADLFKGRFSKEGDLLAGWAPEFAEGYIKGFVPGIGSFPILMFFELAQNYDSFFSRPVFNENNTFSKRIWDIAAHVAPNLLPVIGLSLNNMARAAKGEMELSEALVKSFFGVKIEPTGVGRFEEEEKYQRPGFSLDKNKTEIYDKVKELAETKNKEQANRQLNALYDQYSEYEKYITDRVKAEKEKVEEKNKTQRTIRLEIRSVADLAKKDRQKANKRLNELYDRYPEYESYITKKVAEANENNNY